MKAKLLLSLTCLFLLAANTFTALAQNDADYENKKKKVAPPRINHKKFYDYRGSVRKNMVKIHALGLSNKVRLQYERIINRNVNVGAISTYHFSGNGNGTIKFEPFGKYFIANRSPFGGYLIGNLSLINFQNKEVLYRYGVNEAQNQGIQYRPSYGMVESRNIDFFTFGGCLGFGFQNMIGPKKNIVIDFSVGYQFYVMPGRVNKAIVKDGRIYNDFDKNDDFWGIGSPIMSRFAIGYAF